jgi:hypothetical protein
MSRERTTYGGDQVSKVGNDAPMARDSSPRATSLVRAIDRLPPGEYFIQIVKPDLQAKNWIIEIIRTEVFQNLTLPRISFS